MSFSDYIKMKALKQTKNLHRVGANITFLSSADLAQHKRICTILDTEERDEYGDIIAKNMFSIPILNDMTKCLPNTYKGTSTTPVVYSSPRITTQNVKLSKNKPIF